LALITVREKYYQYSNLDQRPEDADAPARERSRAVLQAFSHSDSKERKAGF
jgi:hypothetical protein